MQHPPLGHEHLDAQFLQRPYGVGADVLVCDDLIDLGQRCDAKRRGHVELAESASWLFAGAVALTLGNPKVMVFFLALLPTVIDLREMTVSAFAHIAGAICIILSGVLTMYTVAAMRARRLFQEQASRPMVEPRIWDGDGRGGSGRRRESIVTLSEI